MSIYLDNAATTEPMVEVIVGMCSMINEYGNPSSAYELGRKANKIIDNAKDKISSKLNCNKGCLSFTMNATMGNSLLLQGFEGDVYVSSIEHEDILMLAERNGYKKLPVKKNGQLDLYELDVIVKNLTAPTLFSIQGANSVIGVVQDLKEISNIIHKSRFGYLHSDVTQYLPYYNVDIEDLRLDAITMSGHKIECIKGIGLLYISERLSKIVKPLIVGKQGFVGGTENTLGIHCLGICFDELKYDKNEEIKRLRNLLIEKLNGVLVGELDNRLPNNVCVMFEGVRGGDLVVLLDTCCSIYCSAGSACSESDDTPSSTLLAIGLSEDEAKSCVRFTLGKETSETEILLAADLINRQVEFMKGLGNATLWN